MADPTAPHPSKEVLFAFAEGLETDADLRTLETHVAECAICALTLEQFNIAGGLLKDLRSAFVEADAATDPGGETLPGRDDIRILTAVQAYFQSPTRAGSLGRLGHYELLELAGRGAFGTVFKAYDDVLHRIVALKLLTPDLVAAIEARRRFLREARAAAAIRHDNVIQIYSVHEDPLPYLVMEFIPGLTVQQRLDKIGPFSPVDVARMGRQIAAGLAAAHAQGLIHRDIKPGNILIDPGEIDSGEIDPDEEGRVKITDFGLARPTSDSSLSQIGMIAGTPQYMSPEQVNGDELDFRSDLFSLGTVLYAMLCGHSPFLGTSTLKVIKSVSEDRPRPIAEIVPQVPPELCAIIDRLHAQLPAERFQTAREVADALSRCCVALPSIHSPVAPLIGSTKVDGAAFRSSNEQASSALDQNRKSDITAEMQPAKRRLPVWKSTIGWGIVALVILLTVIIIRTNESEFIIETESPDVATRLDQQNGILVENLKTGQSYRLTRGKNRLPNGDYDLNIKAPEGLEFDAPHITIKRFGSVLATVRARPLAINHQVAIADQTNFALKFVRGNSLVEIPSLVRDNSGPLTIELRLKLAPRLDPDEMLGVVFSLEGEAAFQIQQHFDDTLICCERGTGEELQLTVDFTPDVWRHVACVLDEGEQRIYIDGQEMARGPRIPSDETSPLGPDNSSVTMLGSQAYEGYRLFHGMGGSIDEVRVSKSARYTQDFVPVNQFETDPDTLALYHCDEGRDDILHDASGHEHHGKLVGVKWIRFDKRTGAVQKPRSVDAQRVFADYLVTHNAMFDCNITSTGQLLKEVATLEQIPSQPFRICGVSLHTATDAQVREVVDLAAGRVPFHIIYISNGFGATQVSSAVLRDLARLTSLDNVSLDGLSPFREDDLDALVPLPGLWLLNFGNMPVGDEIIKRLPKFNHVTQLLLNNCGVTDDGLRPLQTLPLNRLYLRTPHLTDRACIILAEMPRLEDLTIIDSGGFTGATLDKLPPDLLRRLQIGGTGLREESLRFLSRFSKLETLWLHETGFTDTALEHLSALSITSLQLRGTRITNTGLDRLRVALPNCQIESN